MNSDQIPIVFLNGDFLPENHAFIPINDRGFLFGDGIFTSLKVVEGKTQCLSLHLKRLKEQCQAIGMIFPSISLTTFDDIIAYNHAFTGIWKLKIVITGGRQPGLSLKERFYGQLLMTLVPYQQDMSTYRLTVYPQPIIRPSSQLKSLSYIDRFFISDYAVFKGFDDAITTDCNGFLLETAFSNLFWRNENCIVTPDPRLSIMPGVALEVAYSTAAKLGIEVIFSRNPLSAISPDSNVFICNALKGVVPVIAIDNTLFERDLSWETSFRKCYESIIKNS